MKKFGALAVAALLAMGCAEATKPAAPAAADPAKMMEGTPTPAAPEGTVTPADPAAAPADATAAAAADPAATPTAAPEGEKKE